MKIGAFEGEVLKHSRDTSLGKVCMFIPEWNLKDITDPESNLFLDILKHRATTSLYEQYRSGHNGTAGDLDLIDKTARIRNMPHIGDFKNCFTIFCEGKYGFSLRVTDSQRGKEFLSGLESAFRQRYIIPESLGQLIVQRQLLLLQILNLTIDIVLHQRSETRDRSQVVKRPKPATTPLPSSMSKQVTVKLNPQDLSAIASDQKSSLQEYLSLLRTEPDVLCSSDNMEFFSRPELLPDEKGRSLSVHTDRYVGQLCSFELYDSITDSRKTQIDTLGLPSSRQSTMQSRGSLSGNPSLACLTSSRNHPPISCTSRRFFESSPICAISSTTALKHCSDVRSRQRPDPSGSNDCPTHTIAEEMPSSR